MIALGLLLLWISTFRGGDGESPSDEPAPHAQTGESKPALQAPPISAIDNLLRYSKNVSLALLFTTSKKTTDLSATADGATLLRFQVEQLMRRNGTDERKLLRVGPTAIFSFSRRFLIHFVIMMTPEVPEMWKTVLEAAGFDVRRYASPIQPDEIQNKQIAKEVVEDGAMGITEMVKLEGFRMSEFSSVLMVDCDIFFHKNFEELFDLEEKGDLVWTRGAWDIEWLNGGFLVFHPQSPRAIQHFNRILEIHRTGDFRPGTGWRGAGVGWTYGGRTIQGLLPYYFLVELPLTENATSAAHRDQIINALSATAGQRARGGVAKRVRCQKVATDYEVDHCQYNNMVALPECKQRPYESVTSNHFTGECQKPWWCHPSPHPLCKRFHSTWREVAEEFARLVGTQDYKACTGRYNPLPKPNGYFSR